MLISKNALSILTMMDGKTTMEQIKTQRGQQAVDFIGTLAINGLVDFNACDVN